MMRLSLMLLLLGCGVEPVSQPQAVRDDRAVLGLRPVERDGVTVYKMLICKKTTDVYRQEMFDDDSICRPALLSETGKEVLFPREHAHKDRLSLATGIGKGAVVTLALVTATVVGGKHVWKWLRSLRLNNVDAKTIAKYNNTYRQAQKKVSKAQELVDSSQKNYDDVVKMQKKHFGKYTNRYPVYFIRRGHFKAWQTAKKKLDRAKTKLEEAKRLRDDTGQLKKQIEKVHSLQEQGGDELVEAQRKLIEIDQARPLNFSRKVWVAIGAGLTGLTTTAISKTDILNWGYGERQLGRYWFRIFYKSGDFNHAEQIDDLLPVIRAIASTFNYQVNDKALDLLRS